MCPTLVCHLMHPSNPPPTVGHSMESAAAITVCESLRLYNACGQEVGSNARKCSRLSNSDLSPQRLPTLHSLLANDSHQGGNIPRVFVLLCGRRSLGPLKRPVRGPPCELLWCLTGRASTGHHTSILRGGGEFMQSPTEWFLIDWMLANSVQNSHECTLLILMLMPPPPSLRLPVWAPPPWNSLWLEPGHSGDPGRARVTQMLNNRLNCGSSLLGLNLYVSNNSSQLLSAHKLKTS